MDIRTEFIIGKQKDSSNIKGLGGSSEWTGVYGYRPEEVMNPAELFAVIRISTSTSEIGLEKVARLLLDELQQVYYEEDKETKDIIEKLENAIWKMKNRMEVILSREDKVVQSGIDLEMAIIVVEKEYLYAAVIGESKIFIKRGNSFVDISKGLLDGNMMGFLKTGSLKIEENDRIAICTEKVSILSSDKINLALTELDISKVKHLEEDSQAAFLMLANVNLSWAVQEKESIVNDIILQPNQSFEGNIEVDNIELSSDINLDEEVIIPLKDAKTIREERLKRLKLQEQANSAQSKLKEDDIDEDLSTTPKASPLFIQNLKSNLIGARDGIRGRIKKLREPNDLNNDSNKEEDSILIEEQDNNDFSDSEELEEQKISSSINNFRERFISTASKVPVYTKEIWEKTRPTRLSISEKISRLFKGNNKTYAQFFRNLFNKIKQILSALWKIFRKEVIGSGDRRDLYLHANRRKRNRYLLIIVIIIIVIILYSGIRNKQAQQKEKDKQDIAYNKVLSFQNQLVALEPQITDAKGSGDQQKKSDINTQLETINSSIETQKQTGLYVNELDKLEDKIIQDKDSILSIFSFSDPQLIADLGKTYPDAILTGLVFTNNNIYVSDFSRNVIYQLTNNIGAQPSQLSTGLTQPYVLIKNTNGDLIFYDNDTTSGIGKISIKDGKVSRFGNLAGGIIGKIDAAAIFKGNDNLYEIHQSFQQIFKRRKVGAGYDQGGALFITTNPPNWRNDGELIDGIDIAVPYEAYVLIKDKGLKRYLAGGDNSLTYQSFINTLQSDYDSIAKATSIAVTDKYLAVGDPLNSRIMLFSIQSTDQKNLTFVAQYVYRGSDKIFKNIKKITIDDANISIFVLDGTKIIKLDIIK